MKPASALHAREETAEPQWLSGQWRGRHQVKGRDSAGLAGWGTREEGGSARKLLMCCLNGHASGQRGQLEGRRQGEGWRDCLKSAGFLLLSDAPLPFSFGPPSSTLGCSGPPPLSSPSLCGLQPSTPHWWAGSGPCAWQGALMPPPPACQAAHRPARRNPGGQGLLPPPGGVLRLRREGLSQVLCPFRR